MKRKSLAPFIFILLFIAFWSSLLFFVGPKRIVDFLGADSALLVAFVIAALGGVSTATAVSFYSILLTLVAGGTNPYHLGIVAGIGITIGDSLFYYLGKKGRDSLYGKPKQWAKSLSAWLQSKPTWMMPLVTFLYAGFTPFPNDILTVSLGLSKTPYKRIILPLLAANIFLTMVIAVLASHGWFW